MHVLHYIATQADSKEEAFDSVKWSLNAAMGDGDVFPTWYDWFVTGGGRWSSDTDPYNDNYLGDVVHQDDPKFHEYLLTAHKYKLTSTNYWLGKAREQSFAIENILDNIENKQEGLYPLFEESWRLSNLTMLQRSISGEWWSGSHFFDIVNELTYPKIVMESIEAGVDNWYLVPVDFHY